jgi:hypothetical protein
MFETTNQILMTNLPSDSNHQHASHSVSTGRLLMTFLELKHLGQPRLCQGQVTGSTTKTTHIC